MKKAPADVHPRKVTPKVFMKVKKLQEKNPKVPPKGLAKMVKGRVSRSTIDLITKCYDYHSYVFLLGKLKEIKYLRLAGNGLHKRVIFAQLATHRWKARALLLALLSLGFAAIALLLLLWRN